VGVCKRVKNVENNQVEKPVTKFPINGTNQAFVQVKDGRKDQNKGKEVINLEVDNGETINNQMAATEKNNEAGPSKTSHAEILKEQDKQLEKEINAEMSIADANINEDGNGDESSSTGSEFVDATQIHEETVSSDETTNKDKTPAASIDGQGSTASSQNTNQKNKQFLKEAWANMAESEEVEVRLIVDLEKNTDINQQKDDGFQLQLSKSQKKAHKKKQSSRDSYATRSKGANPKPFR